MLQQEEEEQEGEADGRGGEEAEGSLAMTDWFFGAFSVAVLLCACWRGRWRVLVDKAAIRAEQRGEM